MQLENRSKTKKKFIKIGQKLTERRQYIIYVLDLGLIFRNMVIQDHIGDHGAKNPLYLTANLTNKEFAVVWFKELNL